ncbi:MAG: fibronectin type III domain-containing protein [Bacteroidales bacterium]|nr:fibronectin type III domain-containing protein [Bacteroidales bacterium]
MKPYRLISFFLLAVLAACRPDDPVVPQEIQAPSGVKCVTATQTTLVFSWNEVDGADYYVARLEKADGTLVSGGQTSTRETSIRYDGLTPETAYSFKVRVRADDMDSPYSAALSASTLKPGEEPEPGPDPDPQPTPNEYYAQFKIPGNEDAHRQALAFPGAEGGGMFATGGRGGKVIHVTNLNDSGPGSLRAALAESGARTIVFDVAGVIELNSGLNISKGDVTIAGQTAPGDGICIKNFSTRVNSSNVIIRFVRFRMGDEKKNEGDAIWGRYFENIILDHCSMSWCTDECASFYANCNFTMQWCVIAESLRNSIHGKGKHGYGGIWGGKDASFHHNLLAHHDSRNPRIDHPQIYGNYVETHRGNVDYRCNAVYNWGSNHTYGGENGWFNIVNNYYKPGPASSDRKYFVDAYGSYVKDGTVYADNYAEMYLSGNVNASHPELDNTVSSVYWHNGESYGNYNTLLSASLPLNGPSGEDIYTTTHSAEQAFGNICAYAGASLVRGAVDERVCSDALEGKASFNDGGNGSKGGIIDTQSAVGGWPAYEAEAGEIEMVKDMDGDGMPDWFEDKFGLDKADPSDGNSKTLDIYGRYTDLEMYLHYLVRDIVEKQNAGGVYQKIS